MANQQKENCPLSTGELAVGQAVGHIQGFTGHGAGRNQEQELGRRGQAWK